MVSVLIFTHVYVCGCLIKVHYESLMDGIIGHVGVGLPVGYFAVPIIKAAGIITEYIGGRLSMDSV